MLHTFFIVQPSTWVTSGPQCCAMAVSLPDIPWGRRDIFLRSCGVKSTLTVSPTIVKFGSSWCPSGDALKKVSYAQFFFLPSNQIINKFIHIILFWGRSFIKDINACYLCNYGVNREDIRRLKLKILFFFKSPCVWYLRAPHINIFLAYWQETKNNPEYQEKISVKTQRLGDLPNLEKKMMINICFVDIMCIDMLAQGRLILWRFHLASGLTDPTPPYVTAGVHCT